MTSTAPAPTIHDPVGAVEIAERLGVTLATVHSWRSRRKHITEHPRWAPMPEPDATVSNTPIWAWETIRAWADDTGRKETT